MIAPVSGNSDTPKAAAPSAPAPAAAPAATTPAANAAPVTVQISLTAQVKQLESSGSSLQDIVLKTGLDLATVKLLLGQ